MIRSADKENCLPSQVERTLLDNICNFGILTPFERSQMISPNAPILPVRAFPVINGTCVLIMNVSEAFALTEILSGRFTSLQGINFIAMW